MFLNLADEIIENKLNREPHPIKRLPLCLLGMAFILCFLFSNAIAQAPAKVSRLEKFFGKDLRFIGNPIIQNSPETGVKVGLAGNYLFKTGKDSLTRSSNMYLQVAYTSKQQFILEPIWNVFTSNETYIFRGRAGYLDFTDHFWGLGSTSDGLSKTDLFYKRVYIQSKLLRKLSGNWFGGVNFRYSNIYQLTWLDLIPDVAGNAGSLIAGLGPNIQADFRDNPFSPQKGWYADMFWSAFGKFSGSNYQFHQLQFDGRYYVHFRKPKQVLAFQAFADFSIGELPFRELPRLGSSSLMRGFFEGRFRDKHYLSAQAEWRQPVYKRIHASAFLGAGEVSNTLSSFNLQRLKVAGGLGLRFLLNPKEHVFVRFDYAWNNEGGSGFYIRINDAF
jgi:hypothetical protein